MHLTVGTLTFRVLIYHCRASLSIVSSAFLYIIHRKYKKFLHKYEQLLRQKPEELKIKICLVYAFSPGSASACFTGWSVAGSM